MRICYKVEVQSVGVIHPPDWAFAPVLSLSL